MSQLIHLFTKKEGSVKNDSMHWRRGVGLVQAVYAFSFFYVFFISELFNAIQRVLGTAQTGVVKSSYFLTDSDNWLTKFVIVSLAGLSHYSWCALKLLKSAILEPCSEVQMNSDTHSYYVYNQSGVQLY